MLNILLLIRDSWTVKNNCKVSSSVNPCLRHPVMFSDSLQFWYILFESELSFLRFFYSGQNNDQPRFINYHHVITSYNHVVGTIQSAGDKIMWASQLNNKWLYKLIWPAVWWTCWLGRTKLFCIRLFYYSSDFVGKVSFCSTPPDLIVDWLALKLKSVTVMMVTVSPYRQHIRAVGMVKAHLIRLIYYLETIVSKPKLICLWKLVLMMKLLVVSLLDWLYFSCFCQ